jgi:hypothetical protein
MFFVVFGIVGLSYGPYVLWPVVWPTHEATVLALRQPAGRRLVGSTTTPWPRDGGGLFPS